MTRIELAAVRHRTQPQLEHHLSGCDGLALRAYKGDSAQTMHTSALQAVEYPISVDALPRVLTVRDEPSVSQGAGQFAGPTCELITTRSVTDAYRLLEDDPSIAIVIADLEAGAPASIEFLGQVRTRFPASIRILLCGEFESRTAAAGAVNIAGVFRLLLKPVDKRALVVAVEEGLRIRRRSQADRTLLQTTLMASVNVLAEVLAISAPRAYQRASFARACVSWAAKELGWPDAWIFAIAAALSQVGRVTLKGDEEGGQFHEEVAYNMVRTIPNLENAAAIIRYQSSDPPEDAGEEVRRGSALLRAALLMDELMERHVVAHQLAPTIMRMAPSLPSHVVEVVTRFRVDLGDQRAVYVGELRAGWIVEQDVSTIDGLLVLSKNHALSDAVLVALKRLSERGMLNEPILVRIPASDTEP